MARSVSYPAISPHGGISGQARSARTSCARCRA
ncbi:Uncharacterised protein [Bordetella pertussis]|nr:Uncharacterised protein [Bordetella pertussis]